MKDKECRARFQINDTVQNVCHAEFKAPRLVCKTPSGTNFVRHTCDETSRHTRRGRESVRQTLPLNQTVLSPVTYIMFVFLLVILKTTKTGKLVYEIAWHMQRSTTYGDPIETKAVGVMD